MTDLIFAGYRSTEAGPADPLRVKWNGVRFALDIGIAVEPTLAAIAAANTSINRSITYAGEPIGADVWQTPAQTLALKHGDCEDFAILKYAVLTKAGIHVRLVVGEFKSVMKENPKHAWCAAFVDGTWRVLDQRFDHLITPDEYVKVNFIPIAAMHDASVVRFGKQFTINEILAGRNA